MNRNLKILKNISEYKHHTSHGTEFSLELVIVFRIKNLLLYAYKLLQKYEQVTQSACALIKKNILMKQLHLAEEEVKRIEIQIESWKTVIESMEGDIKSLRQTLNSLGKFPPTSAYTKIDPYCQAGDFFENDIFLNCDDIFFKKSSESKLSDSQFVLFPQKPPLDYYRDIMYLQMHFDLLLVQGFNFALPLLTTRFSFLNRIIYWPHRPQYGFLDKSKQLQNKLTSIKIPIVTCLAELINAIAEVEKWILFSLNSYDIFTTFMKGLCRRKKELFRELHQYKFRYKAIIFEHNRLIGAISKVDKNFFNKNKDLLKLQFEEGVNSFVSSESSNYTSVSAFSNHSEEKPAQLKKVAEKSTVNDESILPNTKSDVINFNFLPSDFQSAKSKLSTETKTVQPLWYNKMRTSIPSVGRSIPRLKNIFSTPDANLYCQCPLNMPPTEIIRESLLKPGKLFANDSNSSFESFLDDHNVSNSVKGGQSQVRRQINDMINKTKFDPKFKIINRDMEENRMLLKTLSHDDSLETGISRHDTITDRSIVLRLISDPLADDSSRPQRNKFEDCYGILNSFLSDCGYSSVADNYSNIDRSQGSSFANDIFHSLGLEQDILHRSYIIRSFNNNEYDNPVIYNDESNLMESLKLYSKYAK